MNAPADALVIAASLFSSKNLFQHNVFRSERTGDALITALLYPLQQQHQQEQQQYSLNQCVDAGAVSSSGRTSSSSSSISSGQQLPDCQQYHSYRPSPKVLGMVANGALTVTLPPVVPRMSGDRDSSQRSTGSSNPSSRSHSNSNSNSYNNREQDRLTLASSISESKASMRKAINALKEIRKQQFVQYIYQSVLLPSGSISGTAGGDTGPTAEEVGADGSNYTTAALALRLAIGFNVTFPLTQPESHLTGFAAPSQLSSSSSSSSSGFIPRSPVRLSVTERNELIKMVLDSVPYTSSSSSPPPQHSSNQGATEYTNQGDFKHSSSTGTKHVGDMRGESSETTDSSRSPAPSQCPPSVTVPVRLRCSSKGYCLLFTYIQRAMRNLGNPILIPTDALTATTGTHSGPSPDPTATSAFVSKAIAQRRAELRRLCSLRDQLWSRVRESVIEEVKIVQQETQKSQMQKQCDPHGTPSTGPVESNNGSYRKSFNLGGRSDKSTGSSRSRGLGGQFTKERFKKGQFKKDVPQRLPLNGRLVDALLRCYAYSICDDIISEPPNIGSSSSPASAPASAPAPASASAYTSTSTSTSAPLGLGNSAPVTSSLSKPSGKRLQLAADAEGGRRLWRKELLPLITLLHGDFAHPDSTSFKPDITETCFSTRVALYKE